MSHKNKIKHALGFTNDEAGMGGNRKNWSWSRSEVLTRDLIRSIITITVFTCIKDFYVSLQLILIIPLEDSQDRFPSYI